MLIHADMTKRAVSFADEAQWVLSPMAGVERRMLERDGDSVAPATSVVRYRPGSRSRVTSSRWARSFWSWTATSRTNGVNTRPAPTSAIRRGRATRRGARTVVSCSSSSGNSIRRTWNGSSSTPARRSGFPRSPKASLSCHCTASAASGSRWSAGRRTRASSPTYTPAAKRSSLDGAREDEEGRYVAGSWLRNPRGSQHAPFSLEGCLLYVKIGHLPAVVT
jgi:ChrR Cupin-like domain